MSTRTDAVMRLIWWFTPLETSVNVKKIITIINYLKEQFLNILNGDKVALSDAYVCH